MPEQTHITHVSSATTLPKRMHRGSCSRAFVLQTFGRLASMRAISITITLGQNTDCSIMIITTQTV